MYMVMKDDKYFTGHVAFDDLAIGELPRSSEEPQAYIDFLAWTRHPGAAKIWEKQRCWAERAAAKWGGEVVEISSVSQ